MSNSKNGDLVVKTVYPHSFTRWLRYSKENYCIDCIMDDDGYCEITYLYLEKVDNTENSRLFFNSICFLVSSLFLALVIVVYAMFPQLRTLGGKVVMACAASLIGSFTSIASFNLYLLNSYCSDGVCVLYTAVVYFFSLAAFFWMNVMSFELWWTFRGIVKSRKINRRGEVFKYNMYSIYAWGIPLCMTIMMVAMNEYPPPGSISPSIGEFQSYFGELELRIYLYLPMFILLVCNFILFLMTVFNIWRSNNSIKMLRSDSKATTTNTRNMFFVFIKISVVMGISFLLEIISKFTPKFILWYITDAYNVLIGIAFFVIFICKRRVLRLIFNKFKTPQQSKFSASSTT